MTAADGAESLRGAERRLQAAQLSSDVAALADLLDDAVLFTDPGGTLLGKDDDLDSHRSGAQVLHRMEEEDLRVRVVGTAGVTWFLGEVEGCISGQPFSARVRYTRTWTSPAPGRWRVVAAHASVVSG